MSNHTTASQPAPISYVPRRSFMGTVALRVLGRWGARLGLLWIGLMAALAVFGPFIANTHPIAFFDGQSWSSPMLRHLFAADVTLLVSAFVAVVLFCVQRRLAGRALAVWAVVTLVALGVSYALVSPPQAVNMSQYRVALASNPDARAVMTVIPYSPTDRLRDRPGDMRWVPPSRDHLLGTTQFGEDMASRMIHACRIALAIGFIATGIAVSIGVVIGGLMGYFSGWVDLLGMRLVEVFSAIPVLFILIMIVAFYGRNLYLMMVVIGVFGWVGYAEFTRAEFLRLRKQDFVQAGKALGLPLWSILFRHMLPNGLTPVIVTASFGIAGAILTESTLSFLGLGLVDQPSWGQLLNQARGPGGQFFPWIAWPPGIAIFLTVFAYNLLGESLRDALDPKAR